VGSVVVGAGGVVCADWVSVGRALEELPLEGLDAEQALQVSLAVERIAARAQAI
jgi:hypothetical protein